jgi:hypothetical protein
MINFLRPSKYNTPMVIKVISHMMARLNQKVSIYSPAKYLVGA